MRFTDRFIEVRQKIIQVETDELGNELEMCEGESTVKFDPKEISHYTIYQDEPENGTYLVLKTGEEFWIPMPLDRFEQELNEQYARWVKG